MEKQQYICQFCQKEFEPTRRKVQKFCSATCRSKNHHHSKPKDLTSKENLAGVARVEEEKPKNKKTETKIEKMSASGIGNSFWGTVAAEVVTGVAKNAFKKDSDKAVTKGDLEELKSIIKGARYFPVNNLGPNQYGQIPYYDIETGELVYY